MIAVDAEAKAITFRANRADGQPGEEEVCIWPKHKLVELLIGFVV